MKIALGVIIVLLVLWTLWGYYSSNVEQAEYSVLKEENGYEVRVYPSHLVAETTVKGSYNEALSEGFRIIAAYIFGDNQKSEKIAMTAPVTEETAVSEKIAMTAPVTAELKDEERVISFVMPKKYTIDTLPKPNDDRVKIVQVSGKKMAALSFSWFRNESRVEKKKNELLEMLERDGQEVLGTPIYAGYNDPWTPPWMSRNEILVEIR